MRYKSFEEIKALEHGQLVNALFDAQAEYKSLLEKLNDTEYRRDVAEWAVIGLVNESVHLTINDVMDKNSIQMIMENLSKLAARKLLRDSQLEFNDHAELAEMRAHIHYLENHAQSRGLQFKPYLEKMPGTLPDDSFRPKWGYRYWGFRDSGV